MYYTITLKRDNCAVAFNIMPDNANCGLSRIFCGEARGPDKNRSNIKSISLLQEEIVNFFLAYGDGAVDLPCPDIHVTQYHNGETSDISKSGDYYFRVYANKSKVVLSDKEGGILHQMCDVNSDVFKPIGEWVHNRNSGNKIRLWEMNNVDGGNTPLHRERIKKYKAYVDKWRKENEG